MKSSKVGNKLQKQHKKQQECEDETLGQNNIYEDTKKMMKKQYEEKAAARYKPEYDDVQLGIINLSEEDVINIYANQSNFAEILNIREKYPNEITHFCRRVTIGINKILSFVELLLAERNYIQTHTKTMPQEEISIISDKFFAIHQNYSIRKILLELVQKIQSPESISHQSLLTFYNYCVKLWKQPIHFIVEIVQDTPSNTKDAQINLKDAEKSKENQKEKEKEARKKQIVKYFKKKQNMNKNKKDFQSPMTQRVINSQNLQIKIPNLEKAPKKKQLQSEDQLIDICDMSDQKAWKERIKEAKKRLEEEKLQLDQEKKNQQKNHSQKKIEKKIVDKNEESKNKMQTKNNSKNNSENNKISKGKDPQNKIEQSKTQLARIQALKIAKEKVQKNIFEEIKIKQKSNGNKKIKNQQNLIFNDQKKVEITPNKNLAFRTGTPFKKIMLKQSVLQNIKSEEPFEQKPLKIPFQNNRQNIKRQAEHKQPKEQEQIEVFGCNDADANAIQVQSISIESRDQNQQDILTKRRNQSDNQKEIQILDVQKIEKPIKKQLKTKPELQYHKEKKQMNKEKQYEKWNRDDELLLCYYFLESKSPKQTYEAFIKENGNKDERWNHLSKIIKKLYAMKRKMLSKFQHFQSTNEAVVKFITHIPYIRSNTVSPRKKMVDYYIINVYHSMLIEAPDMKQQIIIAIF